MLKCRSNYQALWIMTRFFNNLNQWLDALNNQTLSSFTPEEIFTQVKSVVHELGLNKKLASFVIAITGTNGKGSVATCLEALFCASGKQVGCITSPHLINFNERIRLNGVPVQDEQICKAYNLIEQIRKERALGFAHFAYLAGLLILSKKNLDVLILEVGLGGRLDVMNAVENEMTIITNVDYDHCERLGFTREEIGFEKAALIRKNTPVVIGDPSPPQSVLDKAEMQQAKIVCAEKDFFYEENENTWRFLFFYFKTELDLRWREDDGRGGEELDSDSFFDRHPCASGDPVYLSKSNMLIQNAATALQAFLMYAKKNNLIMEENTLSSVFLNLKVPGRQEKQTKQCDWLLDVAHNPQAVNALVQAIKQGKKYQKVYAIFGMCTDKDILNSLKPMVPLVDEWMLCPLSSVRSAKKAELKTIFKLLHCENFDYHDTVQAALDRVCVK